MSACAERTRLGITRSRRCIARGRPALERSALKEPDDTRPWVGQSTHTSLCVELVGVRRLRIRGRVVISRAGAASSSGFARVPTMWLQLQLSAAYGPLLRPEQTDAGNRSSQSREGRCSGRSRLSRHEPTRVYAALGQALIFRRSGRVDDRGGQVGGEEL